MNVFKNYANYYNLLYKDKNYQKEVDYVDSIIKKHNKTAFDVLDLGCGTGNHDFLLAKKGYNVTGIDISEDMTKVALKRKIENKVDNIEFFNQDIRNINLNKQYDIIISLFHVISYQTTNEDLIKVFNGVAKHLKNGGLFIFDCWYGPTVLTDRPVTRIKRLEDENIHVTRLAEPVMYADENLVDVNYDIIIKDKKTLLCEEIKETHKMRYLFCPEVFEYLKNENLNLIFSEETVTGKKLGFDTWNACFGAIKK